MTTQPVKTDQPKRLPSDQADYDKFWEAMRIKTWAVNWPPGYEPSSIKGGTK